ncbi:unnamed protein product [Withania somnifera]
MTSTIPSTTSFINLKETKGVKTPNDFLSIVSFAQTKPSCRLVVKSSMQEAQLPHERVMVNPMERKKNEKREKLHELTTTHSNSSTKVPVFVMLPLDTMTMGGNLDKPRAMNASLMALKSSGAEGVMVDAWWGLVEKDGPLKYNWEGYAELVKMCQEHGMKLQVVMSFHHYGGNYIRASLAAATKAAGKDDWGRGGPHDSGKYNHERGQFFLEWYSGKLLDHGDRILAAGESIHQGTGAKLSAKIAGIHWHYNTRSHAADMLAKHRAVLNFTCMEMKDGEQPHSANCSPEGLVRQVKLAASTAEVDLAGENALERYDAGAFSQVFATSMYDSGNGLSAFTFLRMNKRLFEPENWRNLVQFCDSSRTDLYVRFIKKSHSEKATEVAIM